MTTPDESQPRQMFEQLADVQCEFGLSGEQMLKLLEEMLASRRQKGLPIPADLPKNTLKALSALGDLARAEAAALAREEQARQDEIDQLPRPKRLEDAERLLQQKCADLAHAAYIEALTERRADVRSRMFAFKNPCGENFSDVRGFREVDWSDSLPQLSKELLLLVAGIPFLIVLVLLQTLLEIVELVDRIAEVIKLTLQINTFPRPNAPDKKMELLGLWRTLVPSDRDLVKLSDQKKSKLLASWVETLFGPHAAYTEEQIAWRVRKTSEGQVRQNIQLYTKRMHATFVPAFDVVLKQVSAELS